MSHLNKYNTRFINIKYLETALKRLGIPHEAINQMDQDLIIKETLTKKGKSVIFRWQGDHYRCYHDYENWIYPLSIEGFTERLNIAYATVQAEEFSAKQGFQIESYTPLENSNKCQQKYQLVATRYNTPN